MSDDKTEEQRQKRQNRIDRQERHWSKIPQSQSWRWAENSMGIPCI